jgi:hypothetical protein
MAEQFLVQSRMHVSVLVPPGRNLLVKQLVGVSDVNPIVAGIRLKEFSPKTQHCNCSGHVVCLYAYASDATQYDRSRFFT